MTDGREGEILTQIPIWVRPGGPTDSLSWEPWRKRWVVACREPPTHGRANRAVAGLMADWLGVPPTSIHWEQVGASRSKLLVVEGLSDAEVERRLRNQIARSHRGIE
ncbi:MAG: DUF167 domain-containing protein [Thermoplasmata archaeon]